MHLHLAYCAAARCMGERGLKDIFLSPVPGREFGL